MTKNILRTLFLVLSLLTFSVGYAQQSNYSGSSRFTDNWSVGVLGGVNTNLHTWSAPQGGYFGIELGRKVTPIFGFKAQVLAGVNDLANWHGHASHIHNGTVVDNLQAYLLGTFNLTNALCGYNGVPRTFEVNAVAGVGYGHGYDHTGNEQAYSVLFKDALLTKVGLEFDFNLGDSKAWTLSLRPGVVFNTTGHGQYCASHAVFSGEGAVVYHLKNSNGKHYMDCAALLDEAEIAMKNNLNANLNKENSELRDENKALKHALAEANNKSAKVDTVAVNSNPYTTAIEFEQGSAKIKNEYQLNALAEQIKANGKKVNIKGYASIEGADTYNDKLSEQRAMVVKDALSKYDGVKRLLGKAVGMGTTTKFGVTLSNNRVVVVE